MTRPCIRAFGSPGTFAPRLGVLCSRLGRTLSVVASASVPAQRDFEGRVFVVSDVHADYAENLAWAERQRQYDHGQDVLILAGDISHDTSIFEHTLRQLTSTFGQVFFTFGNHDLWTRRRSTEPRGSNRCGRLADIVAAKHSEFQGRLSDLLAHLCQSSV